MAARRLLHAFLMIVVAIGPGFGAQQSGQPPAQPGVSPETLEKLLAPIALYPDARLAQVLECSTSPFQVEAINEWLMENQNLKGSELQDAAYDEGFGPSFVALVPFGQVLKMMAEQIDWTRQLGEAFTRNRQAVFDSAQRLRAQAQAAGNLKSSEQQEVKTETTENGQEVIVIQPTNPQVIYVPVYNTQVVYTTPPPATTTTVVVEDNSSDEVAAAAIGFTVGIVIGVAASNSYYWGHYGWYGGRAAYWHAAAWDNYYDHREDMRDDWYDHREDRYDDREDRRDEYEGERSERQSTRQEGAESRQTSRQEGQVGTQAEGTAASRQQGATSQQASQRSQTGTQTATASQRSTGSRQGSYQGGATTSSQGSAGTPGGTTRSSYSSSYESRGYGSSSGVSQQRSGTSSGAFSGYSSGSSARASSSRGRSSMGGRSRGRRR